MKTELEKLKVLSALKLGYGKLTAKNTTEAEFKNMEEAIEIVKNCSIPNVRLSLPDSDEITDAAMEYAEIDDTTNERDESVRDAAHFVAGATWYYKRIKGNGA